jgi:hypothetical protein
MLSGPVRLNERNSARRWFAGRGSRSGKRRELAVELLEGRALMTLSPSTWTAIGPQPVVTPAMGPLAGRITVAVADPANQNVMYVAGDGGFGYGIGSGIWKTTDWLDPNPIWVPVVPPGLAQDIFIHSMAMAPSDPNVLYAASAGPEGGILKTTDGGATWQLLGSPLFAQSSFGAIAVSPLDPNVIFVGVYRQPNASVPVPNSVVLDGNVTAGSSTLTNVSGAAELSPGMPVVGPGIPTNTYISGITGPSEVTLSLPATASATGMPITFQTDGLWQSVDGGQTFVNITPRSIFSAGADFSDLAISPAAPDDLWVGVTNSATNSGKSPNGVWEVVLPLFPAADSAYWTSQMTSKGINTAVGDYIQLAIAPSDPDTIYATIFLPGASPPAQPYLTRWVTTLGGGTWTMLAEPPGGNESRYWHTMLAVSPADPMQIFISGTEGPGTSLYWGEVNLGGTPNVTWTDIPTGEDVVEASFDATGAFVLDSDRGVLRSTDPTAPIPTFQGKRGTLNNTLFHDIAMDPHDPSVVYGVIQDQLFDATTSANPPAWQYVPAGHEIGRVLVDPADPSTVYTFGPPPSGVPNSSLGFVDVSVDGGMTWQNDSQGFNTNLLDVPDVETAEQNDVQAFAIDASDPTRLAAGGYAVQLLDSSNGWSQISPEPAAPGAGYIESLAFAPDGVLYAGTSNGLLLVSPAHPDAKTAWQEYALPNGETGVILALAVNPANSSNVFIAVHNTSGSGDISADDRVLETLDGGQTWRAIGGGIPASLAVFSLVVDWRAQQPILYAGTDRGVYRSSGADDSWALYGQGLPATQAFAMDFSPETGVLAVGTFGRGAYEIISNNPGAFANLSGYVYGAPNGIAASNPNTAGIGGVTVTLAGTDIYGRPVTMTTTTASAGNPGGLPVGSYEFAGLVPGTYTINEGGAAGFAFVGASVGLSGNGVVSARQIGAIRLVAGLQAGGYNFGETKPPTTFVATPIVTHGRPQALDLTFIGDVNPSSAMDRGSYKLVRLRTGRKPLTIAIKAVRYNAATETATLIPRGRLDLRFRYEVSARLPGDAFTPPSAPSQIVGGSR